MLWYWIRKALARVWWYLGPRKERDVAFIDPHAACPVCGARHGRLRAVVKATKAPGDKNEVLGYRVMCQHTCLRCGARSFEAPVVAVTVGNVEGGIARDEWERREDTALALGNYGPQVRA